MAELPDMRPDYSAFRKEFGLTIRKCAKLAGMKSPSNWQHYEETRKFIRLDLVLAMVNNYRRENSADSANFFWSALGLVDPSSFCDLMDLSDIIGGAMQDAKNNPHNFDLPSAHLNLTINSEMQIIRCEQFWA